MQTSNNYCCDNSFLSILVNDNLDFIILNALGAAEGLFDLHSHGFAKIKKLFYNYADGR